MMKKFFIHIMDIAGPVKERIRTYTKNGSLFRIRYA